MDNARAAWDLSAVRAQALLCLALTTAILVMGGFARGQTPRADAHEAFVLAEKDDEALELARALLRYDEVRAIDPGSPHVPRAEARAAMLRAHAEGDFAPLKKLERVRRDPALASDPREIDALVNDAETFPEGLVRVEVWVLAAEAYAHRLGRPRDAMGLLRRVVTAPNVDPVVAKKAARDLVELHLAAGDLAGARDATTLAGPRAEPKLAADVARAGRRHHLHHASIVALVTLALLAVRAWLSAARRGEAGDVIAATRRAWPFVVGYAAYLAIGGGILASRYERGTGTPFYLFGLATVPIALAGRAWGVAGGASAGARGVRAVVCGVAMLGAGFLVLEGVDAGFLEGIGL